MKAGIIADHQDYIKFFKLLILEEKDDDALGYLQKLDTRPKEYILMWLKDEHIKKD